MKRIIFSNAYLADGWAENVLIEIDEAGVICAITANYAITPDDEGTGQTHICGYALPAINNIHSHAFQRAMAGLAEYSTSPTDSFWTWRDLMYRFADNIDADGLQAIAAQLYLEMLKAGYVSVTEFHYLHNSHAGKSDEMSHAIMDGADQAGIALCHLPVLYMSPGFGVKELNDRQQKFYHNVDDYLQLLERLNVKMSGRQNQHMGMAFHSLRAVPEYALKECLENSPLNGPIHIHISEQMREVNDCINWSGRRPVEWLYDYVDVDEKWCLIHATHLNDNEVETIARSGAVVGLCPTTEANLGDGLFPLAEYMNKGGDIAIGSDSHISVSVVEELRLLEYGQRLLYQQRNIGAGSNEIHTGTNLYNHNLRGGAKASGFNNGMLAVGKRADIMVLDAASPSLVSTPMKNVIDRFIFSGNVCSVKHVMVGGDFVIFNQKHKQEEIIKNNFFAVMASLEKYLD